MKVGIDIGSTTVKLVVINESGNIIYKCYERHKSDVFSKTEELLCKLNELYQDPMFVGITGSGGLELLKKLKITFKQEVITCTEAVKRLIPQTDVAIELGGEDAKITYLRNSIEQRMNGTCAGGTGAFIDQMAVLLDMDVNELNEAAKHATMSYPIAARCGVFAKTDLQPLINEGAKKEDLARSIFQAVVDQTISGLACGRKIQGKVAFLGGPLTYLSELRKQFVKTLKLTEEETIIPKDAQYFPALGAAFLAEDKVSISTLLEKIKNAKEKNHGKVLPCLFRDQKEYEIFRKRHAKASIKKYPLEKSEGVTFLGIDAGSTTVKITLIDEKNRLLYSDYANNTGNPVATVKRMLERLYLKIPENAYIGYTVTTGYGEELIKRAFHAEEGVVETIAHSYAAREFLPQVEFILDIGGQDMKCIKIKDQAVSNIILNEACSSGCGSFLETYAKSIGISIDQFAQMAIKSKYPVDLGTRCTVFMNSKVKQAQKEGTAMEDIAAGLSYSVIRNALYKVLKLRNVDEIGQHIVVQGGTFLNDGVLAAFEKLVGVNVIRPDISELMGAYGASLIAKQKYEQKEEKEQTTLLSKEKLGDFQMASDHRRCHGCSNQCQLTINEFSDGGRYVSGNRCEKGVGGLPKIINKQNLFQYKYQRLFMYQPLSKEEAWRGDMGIPRVLNMYENYPFWFTFFSNLGFRVVLSKESSKKIYELGMDTIPSDTVCYPAKLVHGHIRWLVDQGVKYIFYPCITYELEEDTTAENHFNCPVVGLYPELIKGNMQDLLEMKHAKLLHPFLPYFDDNRMKERLYEELKLFGVTKKEIANAFMEARKEDFSFKQEIQTKADEIISNMEREGGHAIVLAGRSYHLDPQINHGIDQMIASYDFVVLPESSIQHLSHLERPIGVLDQWMYHSRLYKAADVCARRSDMDLVQLNSFGCGIDAITTDEVEELLRSRNKIYTVLKIDDGSNLGAARIRIRSLKAAIEEREHKQKQKIQRQPLKQRVVYTKNMKKDYTLLIPQMAPMQFDLLETAFWKAGYRAKLLPVVDDNAIEMGLKYINNDVCYPTIVSLGQIISALLSGKYDLDHTAVLMVQTGGGCRASNYISLLRKALKQLKMEQIPIVSFNFNRKMEQNPGMKFTVSFAYSMLYALLYGDLFMRLTNAMRPYEWTKGSTQKLYEKWNKIVKENIKNTRYSLFKRNVNQIVREFDELPIHENLEKPKVGIVGENFGEISSKCE